MPPLADLNSQSFSSPILRAVRSCFSITVPSRSHFPHIQDPLPDGTGDGFADGFTDTVGKTDEPEVAGEGGDDFFTVAARAFPHDGAEDFDEFVGLVVGHADSPGTDKAGTVGLDDPAPDSGSEVASEGFVDLRAEALVAEDKRNL